MHLSSATLIERTPWLDPIKSGRRRIIVTRGLIGVDHAIRIDADARGQGLSNQQVCLRLLSERSGGFNSIISAGGFIRALADGNRPTIRNLGQLGAFRNRLTFLEGAAHE